MAYVYILKSVNFPITYTDSTTDLGRRLKEHNSGAGSFSRRYMPWKLVYTENLPTLHQARMREKYLKSSSGRRFIKKQKLF